MGVEGDEQPIYLDEVHQDIAEFAARHLEEEERDEFVDSLLERHGYQRKTAWAPPEPQEPPEPPRKSLVAGKKAQGASKTQGSGKPGYFRSR